MYSFILNMWKFGKADEIRVQSYVPKFITQEQADEIVATARAV